MSKPERLLPELPKTVVEHLGDAFAGEGYLRIRTVTLKNKYPDGTESRDYVYDTVERKATDAVVIALYERRDDGIYVCLRSALRPPIFMRDERDVPLDKTSRPFVWELPAGLVEPGEKGADGVLACASRETEEEVGLVVAPREFKHLGAPGFLCPGVIAEKLYYVAAEIDFDDDAVPSLDGSPVEEHAVIAMVPIETALEAARRGEICHVAAELGLRRLAELLADSAASESE